LNLNSNKFKFFTGKAFKDRKAFDKEVSRVNVQFKSSIEKLQLYEYLSPIVKEKAEIAMFPAKGVKYLEKALESDDNFTKYLSILYADKLMTPEEIQRYSFKSLQRQIRDELNYIYKNFEEYKTFCNSNYS